MVEFYQAEGGVRFFEAPLCIHDRNTQIHKGGTIEGIGVKTALKIEKFHVDALGNIYPAFPEHRHGLA